MKELLVRKTTDSMCSCNSCGALNYHSRFVMADGSPVKVSDIYDIKCGITVIHLCNDCIKSLVDKINATMLMEDL